MTVAKKTRYSVTLENGKTATRTSHRTYTHVVVADVVEGYFKGRKDVVLGWCGSRALAEKRAGTERAARLYGENGRSRVVGRRVVHTRTGPRLYDNVRILPVNVA